MSISNFDNIHALSVFRAELRRSGPRIYSAALFMPTMSLLASEFCDAGLAKKTTS